MSLSQREKAERAASLANTEKASEVVTSHVAHLNQAPQITTSTRERAIYNEATKPAPPRAKTERERLIDYYAAEHEREQQEAENEKLRAERKRREAAELAEKKRLRLAEMREQQAQIFSRNRARDEVKQILRDATVDEINYVLAQVEANHCKGFPSAYATYLNDFRSKQVK